MPKISVIVPVYKVEQYLDRCVKSILAQTFTDFELILVDDGSPDNCPQMCDEWAKKDGRIVVIHKENGGLSSARNVAIDWAFENSDSEWLTFIDSDDWVHPEYLERLLSAALNNDAKVSVCGYYETYGEVCEINEEKLNALLHKTEDFYVEHNINAIIACAKLYHKSCFNLLRYPIDKLHEDEYVTYKIIFENPYIAFLPAPLYYYFDNSGGITKSVWNINRMDVLTALYEQTEYFRNENFKKAEKFAEFKYMCYFEKYINLSINFDISDKTKAELQKKHAKEMRSFLKKRRKSITLKRHPWYYEQAYPRIMQFYWTYKGIISKIKKTFGSK